MRNVVCVSGADVTRGSGRRDGLEGETEVTFAGSFDAQQREAGVVYPTMKRAVLESRETGDGGDIVETVSYPENVHSAKGADRSEWTQRTTFVQCSNASTKCLRDMNQVRDRGGKQAGSPC